ncbi:MAG: histidinol-phosphate transaminase [Actinomycetia bacterium]|nr:histidinol-phosphate transaminase [Actinomycetes bacterium]
MTGNRPPLRDDLITLEGYHSPQLDVEVRLNTNEAPGPPPAAFIEAFAEAARSLDWHRYPDRAATTLRTAIAAAHGVQVGNILAANGSNEVLQTLLLGFGGPGRSCALFEPTYAMYGQIARTTGTEVIVGDRAPDFALDIDEVERVVTEHQPSVTFLCSPNNPTGMVDPPGVVERVLELVAPHRGLVVVDEAYGQFAPHTALDLLGEDVPLVVSRTFSKTWAMAGARLGYLVGPEWLVAELDKVVLPYHLDSMTQLAGTIALDFVAEMEKRVAEMVEERGRIMAAFSDLPVEVWPSGANFVLFRPTRQNGNEVWQALVDRSILVRNCSSWPRLEGCLRLTIGTRAEDDRFLTALTEILT